VETIGARVQSEGMSSPIRLHFWRQAWLMFTAAPIFGLGFKQFAWNNFLLTGQFPGTATDQGIIDHAHNLIFQVGAEFGVCGLIVLLGGLAWWGWSLRRAQIDPAQWWMVAVLGVLGLHSMLEYPLWYAYFLGIAAMVMGAAECGSPSVHDKSSGRLILCMCVLLGLVAFTNVYRDYRVMQSLQHIANHEPATASGPGNSSVQVLLDLQRSSLFAPFIEFALARRMLLNQEHLKDKIVLNQRAMHFQPSSDFAYRQALLLALSGDLAGMRAQWDLAVANFPNDRAEVLTVAQALDKSGESGMKQLLSYAQQENGKAEK
jgi:Virulence factor membrane-bound polymerase, C-terminal/O-Antigen ligase